MTPLRRLILAAGLTNLGDGMMVLAWAWMASLLTRDAMWIALVPAAVRLPWLLLAVPAGLLTDRCDRRRLVALSDGVRALALAILALLIQGAGPLPEAPEDGVSAPGVMVAIIVTALVVGSAEVMRDSAANTMLPGLVLPDQMERAYGHLWSAETVGNELAGPALGALLIGWILAAPFAASASLYLVGGVVALGVAGQFRPTPTPGTGWQDELSEAAAFLRGQPLLKELVWITAIWCLFAHMALVGLVLHGQENLGFDAQTYGLVLAAGAIGGVLGGWLADGVVARLGPGRTAQLGSVVGVPAFAMLAFAEGPVAAATALFVFGLGGVFWNAVSVSYRQRRVPDAIRGRVSAIFRLAAFGAIPLGMVLSGVVVRSAEALWSRPVALMLPFLVAAVGIAALNAIKWRRIGTGFGVSRTCPPHGHKA